MKDNLLFLCFILEKAHIYKINYFRPIYNNVIMDDFTAAISHVMPSIQRGFQVNFEETNWDDIGGLDTVKKVKI